MSESSSQPKPPSQPVGFKLELDQRVYGRAQDCVHCGLCLPACPTYTQNGLETDSPRGRIMLMKAMADQRIGPAESVLRHLDLCLDCRACETACPSGVIYHELIEQTRHELNAQRKPTAVERLIQAVVLHVFPWPTRTQALLLPVRLLQKAKLWKPLSKLAARWLPEQLEKMQSMLPDGGPLWHRKLREHYPPTTNRVMRVGFFAGCVGSAMFQPTNRRAIALLQKFGCEVVVPRRQVCCGAIHHHNAKPRKAEWMAKRNIEAFEGVDRIVTDIAGCGAMLKEYHDLLRHDEQWRPRAEKFVNRMQDVSELLVELDPPAPPRRVNRRVTYHDACHLAHAQQVTDPPRQLLDRIPGLQVVPLAESDICCGAAGTYNLTEPKMARDLAERKLKNIEATGCRVVVMGNVGCAMQVDSEARRLGMALQVVHPVDLLHEAYFGSDAERAEQAFAPSGR